MPTLQLAQRPEADALLAKNPLALLIGMLLDQQVAMEWAFTGPYTISERLGRDLDAADLAARDPDELAALMSQKPAVHRYPGSMAKRIHTLCAFLVERYDGDAAAIWRDASSGAELFKRLNGLPGFGKQKAQIFTALLGKQLEVAPPGWREAAGAYGEEGSHRSVADVTDSGTLEQVRTFKKEAKAAQG
jgi:uncharacterized HhH-GPD family protein